MPVTVLNFAEELQDAVAAFTGPDPALVVGENFTLGNVLDVGDLEGVLTESVVLTMFEEGFLPIRTGRSVHQERTVRFLYKGSYGQEALNRCLVLWKALEDALYITTATYRVIVLRTDKGPGVVGADESGTHLADFIVTFFVKQITG